MAVKEFSDLRAAREASEKLKRTAAELANKHAALLQERGRVNRQLAPLAEVHKNIDRLVDAARDEFIRMNGRSIAKTLAGGVEVYPGTTRESATSPVLPRSIGRPDGLLTFTDLAGLVPAVLKAQLKEVVAAARADHAESVEARTRRLADIDRELADVEHQHTEMVDGAAEFGVSIPLLPHVQRQRDAERARAEGVPMGARGATGGAAEVPRLN